MTTKLKLITMSRDSSHTYAGGIRFEIDPAQGGTIVVSNIDSKAERHIPCSVDLLNQMMAAIAHIHDSCPHSGMQNSPASP